MIPAAADSATDTGSVDQDADGYVAAHAGGDDCDDGDAAVHPGAAEACNLVDDDCDGVADQGCPTTLAGASTDGPLTWSCAHAELRGGLVLTLLAAVALRRARGAR